MDPHSFWAPPVHSQSARVLDWWTGVFIVGFTGVVVGFVWG